MGAILLLKLLLGRGSSFVGVRQTVLAIQRVRTLHVGAMHRMIEAEPHRDAITAIPHVLHEVAPICECSARFRRLGINASYVQVTDTRKAAVCSAKGVHPLIQDGGQFRAKLPLVIVALTST